MKNLLITALAIVALLSCFLIAEAQVSTVPSPTLQKAIVEEIQGNGLGSTGSNKPGVIRIRGNWAYPVPKIAVQDPWKIDSVRFRATKKVYATIEDSVNGKGEGLETSTGWYTVPHVAGEGANGIINTLSQATLTPGKVNRLVVDMSLTGEYKGNPFTWKQSVEELFFGEGVK